MSKVNADSFNNAAGTGAPDFPNGLTSEGSPVGGLKVWAVLTDYTIGDVVFSGGADSTLNKIYKASSTHTSGAVSLLADIANWTELSEQSTTPYNIIVSPGDDIHAIIEAAVSGDRIFIKDGTYVLAALEKITVSKGVSITGESIDGTIISGGVSDDLVFEMIDYNTVTQQSRLTTLERAWDSAAGDGTASATYGNTLVTLSTAALAMTETGFISLDGVEYTIVATPSTSTLTLGEDYKGQTRAEIPYQIREGDFKTVTTIENMSILSTSSGFGSDQAMCIDTSESANIHLRNLRLQKGIATGFFPTIRCQHGYKHNYDSIDSSSAKSDAIIWRSAWFCYGTNLDIEGGLKFQSSGSQHAGYGLKIEANRILQTRDQRPIFFNGGGSFFRGSVSIKSITGGIGGNPPITGFNGGFIQSVFKLDYMNVTSAATPAINFDADVIEGNTFYFGNISAPAAAEVCNIKSWDSTAGRANVIATGTFIGTLGCQGCVVAGGVQADAYADVPVQNNGYTF